jgi:RNA polymerase sigma-70 factor (ECF subfamily)
VTAAGSQAKSVQPVTSYNEQELAALMVSYQRGDRGAGEALVRALSPQLYRFLSLRHLNPAMNEDVLQDCWLEIHRSRNTYQPGRPVLPWIYGIARHVRARAAQRRRRKRESETSFRGDEPVAAAPGEALRDDLLDLLDRLPESQREALYLLKFVGLTLEETAAATRSTVGAVKQRAYRAYEALRALRRAEEAPIGERQQDSQ